MEPEDRDDGRENLHGLFSLLREFRTDLRANIHDVSELKAGFSAIQSSLRSIGEEIKRLSHQTSQPTNWIGVGVLVLALVAANGTYIQTRVTPIEAAAKKNDITTENNAIAIAELRGGVEAYRDWFRTWLETDERQIDDIRAQIKETLHERGQLEGRQEVLREMIRDLRENQ
jgi:uncharacterized coiled-coil DUF342 family protein